MKRSDPPGRRPRARVRLGAAKSQSAALAPPVAGKTPEHQCPVRLGL